MSDTIDHAVIIPPNTTKGRLQSVVIGFFRAANYIDFDAKEVLRFYSDELDFSPEEFEGLTQSQVNDLFARKDKEYLLS